MENLTNKIIDAAKYSFLKLIDDHPNETIYAFIIYTDEDCYTILPAANSLEKLKEKVLESGNEGQINSAEYKWSSAEWAYESAYDEKFSAICKILSEQAGKTGSFPDFKKNVHRCMIAALKRMDEENFFGHRRENLMLYISSSDHDESIKMENESAKQLNSKQKYDAFLKRYD